VTSFGKPYTAPGFGNWFRELCDAAECLDVSAHGLRRGCARRLAEIGCSANQIAAITGHATLARIGAFLHGLHQLGWVDGLNVVIDYRWGAGDHDRIGKSAQELVALAPDVILAIAAITVSQWLRRARCQDCQCKCSPLDA
jgi:hypothetical protein